MKNVIKHLFQSRNEIIQTFIQVKDNIIKQQSVTANQCKDCLKVLSSVFNKKRHEKVCSAAKGEGKVSSATDGESSNGVENIKKTQKKQ